jgi:hypothetical protein
MGDSRNTLFGQELRTLRRRFRESLAEVSGAVEIDVKDLGEIEAGQKLPSEDVVMLLISHFSLREDEALRLWRLAGFDNVLNGISQNNAQSEYITENDNRILYTDMIQVSANNYGVILNFLQGIGSDGKPSAVARVGMSREHAKSIVAVLSKTLDMAEKKTEPKKLTEGK